MQTSHKLTRIFFALATLIVLALSALAQPNTVFDGAPGTNPPPPTLGGYTMVPFGPDARADFTNIPSVAVPAGSRCGGEISFTPNLELRRIATGTWNQNWGAYTGEVYWTRVGVNQVVITLPAGTRAFSFYAGSATVGVPSTVTATAADGTTSGAVAVANTSFASGVPSGKYFGFYATGNTNLTTITVTSPDANGFGIGQFAITCLSPSVVSDQKAGSLLVYPYYTSDSQTKKDTRVTLSNVGTTTLAVHIFFMDSSCNQADQYLCLTPNASIALKASDFDPDTKNGWILATAVNASGIPTVANSLIGNAFVVDGDYIDNYGAEAFWAFANGVDNGDGTSSVLFGRTHDSAPNSFAAEIQSLADAAGQRIVTVGLSGDITRMTVKGAGQVGIGELYNGNEKPFGSFSKFLSDGCRAEATIKSDTPRVPLGIGNLIQPGQVGTLKWRSGPSVGLIMTPRTAKWSGIRTLHKLTFAGITELRLPVFLPSC